MIRGGHVDATFLGTLQVDEKGNIANWIVPGKMLAGMGGAMDLITGAKVVNIVSEHCSKDGASKLMKACTFPLTGAEEADVIITERALFRRYPDKGWVLEEVAAATRSTTSPRAPTWPTRSPTTSSWTPTAATRSRAAAENAPDGRGASQQAPGRRLRAPLPRRAKRPSRPSYARRFAVG